MEFARATDAELCGYLDSGDVRAAGSWLVQRYAHEVVSLCRAMVRNLEAAEDLAQEVFGQAFVGLRSFRGEASSRTWLLRIARNRCIDYLRARSREPSEVSRVEGSEPDQHPDRSPLPSDLVARRHQLKIALDSLGELERAMVVLRFRHGLDYRELAEVFGMRAGTIRMRLSRALARMREILEKEPREAPVARASVRPAGPRASFDARRAVAEDFEADEMAVPAMLPDLDRDADEEEPRLAPSRRPTPPEPSRRPPPGRQPPPAPQRVPAGPRYEPPRGAVPSVPARASRAPAPSPPAPPQVPSRPAGPPAPALVSLREALAELDPGVPVGLLDRLIGSAGGL